MSRNLSNPIHNSTKIKCLNAALIQVYSSNSTKCFATATTLLIYSGLLVAFFKVWHTPKSAVFSLSMKQYIAIKGLKIAPYALYLRQ